MNTSFTAPQTLGRLQRLGLVGGIACVAVSLLALLTSPANFFRAYLVGFIFCLGIALGGLAFLMLQYLTGGAWGLVIRRILEAAARTLPVVLYYLFRCWPGWAASTRGCILSSFRMRSRNN
jgi:hypothetical protein